uniref:Uncharacterized protein n=1 Tax=Anguilla anguilla TaxID=7936 RepID=A0A0E9VLI4_ANGAN
MTSLGFDFSADQAIPIISLLLDFQ